jgi:hypothetical protein
MTWESQPVWILTGIESNLAIICASAPTLKVFFDRYIASSSFTKSLSYFWTNTASEGHTGAHSETRTKEGRKGPRGQWSWSDRNTVDTEMATTEFHSSEFADEKGPVRLNGGRGSRGPSDIPLDGVVVTTEVTTSITSPKRITSYDSQASSRPAPRESLGPGVAYAGNYRLGKNL